MTNTEAWKLAQDCIRKALDAPDYEQAGKWLEAAHDLMKPVLPMPVMVPMPYYPPTMPYWTPWIVTSTDTTSPATDTFRWQLT